MSISSGFIVISEIKPGKDELIIEAAPIRSAPVPDPKKLRVNPKKL